MSLSTISVYFVVDFWFFCYNSFTSLIRISMQQNQYTRGLSRGQKTGFVLLLLFAILTISLGTLQLRNTIYGPFVVRLSNESDPAASLLSNETLRLQQIDTDQDGLTDYEELSFYETSPYLPDTDSDGIDDKVEIDRGTNPLCVEGSACDVGNFVPEVDTEQEVVSPLSGDGLTAADILVQSQFGGENADASSTMQVLGVVNNPAQLRQMLAATGQIDAQLLASIDDAALVAMAQELLAQQFNISATSTPSDQ